MCQNENEKQGFRDIVGLEGGELGIGEYKKRLPRLDFFNVKRKFGFLGARKASFAKLKLAREDKSFLKRREKNEDWRERKIYVCISL